MEENKTPIYLTDEEVEVFKWLWKKYDALKNGKEICRPGNIVLHCNKAGEIKSHEFHIFNNDNFTGTIDTVA